MKIVAKFILTTLLLSLVLIFNQCVSKSKKELVFEKSNDNNIVSTGQTIGASSLQAFENTVYPVTRKYCIGCHQTQSPQHASSEVETAHNAVVDQYKVNFGNIPKSRLVLKLKDEFHNCWSDCAENAKEMEQHIRDWYDQMNSDDKEVGGSLCQVEIVEEEIEVSDNSIEEFENSLYQITTVSCVNCHVSNQYPRHANADPLIAHNELMDGNYIDFDDPANSYLYQKIQGNHQGRSNLAPSILSAITQWSNNRKPAGIETVTKNVYTGDCGSEIPNSTPKSLTIQRILNGEAIPDDQKQVELNIANANIIDNDFEFVTISGKTAIQSKNGTPSSTGTAVSDGGYATISFNLSKLGNYELKAEVYAPSGSEDSFWLTIDNQNYIQWHANNTNVLQEQTVTQNSNKQKKVWQNLSPGSHTLHIRHRENNAAIGKITIVPDGAQSYANGSFSLDISGISGVPGATINGVITNFDDYSYQLGDITISAAEDIYIKNIKVLVNGFYNPLHSTYTLVDKVVGPSDPVVSTYSMLVLKDLGPNQDQIQFQFEIIQQN